MKVNGIFSGSGIEIFDYKIKMENIRKNKPADGLVQVLKITEKQFGKMEFIVGTKKSEILDTDERVVII